MPTRVGRCPLQPGIVVELRHVRLKGVSGPVDELLRAAGFGKSRKQRAPAQYYDPSSGNSWTGRGPRPKWLDGKVLKDCLVDRAAKPWWPGEEA
ncbi:H-NS family nucleoid-associated regulatory protein [Burkholderia sp. BCC1996]|uniref:H-NS family nucleoid-associated regulatory protein n=1 Tax=unclassified Burkholderia TaxID=2613784 RepID=UPI0039EE9677